MKTYRVVVTANHIAVGDLLTEAVEGFVGVNVHHDGARATLSAGWVASRCRHWTLLALAICELEKGGENKIAL